MKKIKLKMTLIAIIILVSIPYISLGGEVKSGPELIESVPVDGATSVKVNAEIHLLFNKNIVNMNVIENNKNNVKLIDGNGKEVSIDILYADDQIEPEKKRELRIIPMTSLEKDTKYKIQILSGFKAKNGIVAGKVTEVGFETEKEELKPDTIETNVSQTETEKDVVVADKSSESIETSTRDEIIKEDTEEKSTDEKEIEDKEEIVEEEEVEDEDQDQDQDVSILEQSIGQNDENEDTVQIEEPTSRIETEEKDKASLGIILIAVIIIVGIVLFLRKKRT